MNNHDLLKLADEIKKMASEIKYAVNALDTKTGPWTRWYAWRPVTTINNERVWAQRIYRRTQYTILKRYAGYEYATDFDLLKEQL